MTFVIEEEDRNGDLVDLLYFCDRECASQSKKDLTAKSVRDSRPLAYEAHGREEADYDIHCQHCKKILRVGFETIREATEAAKAVRERARDHAGPSWEHEDFDDDGWDLRAQYLDGWNFHSGDPQYDTNHRGYWGYTTVGATDDDTRIENLVADLLEEAVESYNSSCEEAVEA